MRRIFERHRDAEAARDYEAILSTFVDDCFLETHPLGLRSEGKATVGDRLMEGESVYFDLATLCEQAGLPIDDVRAGANARARAQSSAVG